MTYKNWLEFTGWKDKYQQGGLYNKPNRKEFVDSVMNANANKNFVKRYQYPNQYPVINNPDGSFSTHRMAYDKNRVYPTIVQDKNGNLINFGNNDNAWNYADTTGEYIEFPTEEQAKWFASSKDNTSGYKMGTQNKKEGGWLDDFSVDGYKKSSKDKNNPYNIIPSKNITMSDVEHPVYGIDARGNAKMMYPENNYTFASGPVLEIPIKQKGGWADNTQAQMFSEPVRGITQGTKTYQERPLPQLTPEQIAQLNASENGVRRNIKNFDVGDYLPEAMQYPGNPAYGAAQAAKFVGNMAAYPIKAINNLTDPSHAYIGNPYSNMVNYAMDADAAGNFLTGLAKMRVKDPAQTVIKLKEKSVPYSNNFPAKYTKNNPTGKTGIPTITEIPELTKEQQILQSYGLNPNTKRLSDAELDKRMRDWEDYMLDESKFKGITKEDVENEMMTQTQNRRDKLSTFVAPSAFGKGEPFEVGYEMPFVKQYETMVHPKEIQYFDNAYRNKNWLKNWEYPEQYTDFGIKTPMQRMINAERGRTDQIPESLLPKVRQQNQMGGDPNAQQEQGSYDWLNEPISQPQMQQKQRQYHGRKQKKIDRNTYLPHPALKKQGLGGSMEIQSKDSWYFTHNI